MNKLLYYKGYSGSIEFSEEDQLFYGKVLGIRSLISYEGKTLQQLSVDFHKAIELYLETLETEKSPRSI